MIYIPRWAVALSALIFASYDTVVGAIWLTQYRNPTVGAVALAIYTVCVVLSIAFYPGERLPKGQAWVNLGAAIVVPILVNSQIDTEVAGTFATWYVGAIGILLTATAVRGYRLVPWLGLANLFIQVVIWGGWGFVMNSGIVGAFLFVAAGQGLSQGIRVTSRSAQEYREQATRLAAESTEATVSRAERQRLITSALQEAVPTLTLIMQRGGKLNASQRAEALRLEAQLRDEIRGRALISPAVRQAASEARQRGVEVLLLDDGGLDGLEPQQVADLQRQVAELLAGVQTGKVTVRTVKGEDWKVTVVATRSGAAAPDLWIKLS